MANVRYTSGGSSATLGTKTIDENGIYNAVDDDLDGYSQVTVDVPAPSGAVNLSYTANGSYSENIEQYQTAEITVDVPIPTVNTQAKTVTATTSQQTVTPNPGYYLNSVTVNPQQHSATFTPNIDTAANDMGPVNNYRYVNTSGMINPTGTLEVEYTTNGPHTESVRQYDNISIDIDVPVSGDLGTKTITVNGTYKAIDDNLDGYSEVDVNVPQNATLGIKTITNNGNYYATADGYDGFSRVDVNVSGAALQSSKTVTATTSQQTVTPDVGYDGLEQVIVDPQVHTQTYTPAADTAANDMGAQNNYRYVDTSGMVVPGSVTPSNSTPAALTSGSAVTPTGNGYAIQSYTSVTPTSTPTSISSGDIVKIGGNGVIVDSVPTPTSVTPSDSNPPSLTANVPVTPTAQGYLYESSGLGKCKTGSFIASSAGTKTITLGFTPKYISIIQYNTASKQTTLIYNSDLGATCYRRTRSDSSYSGSNNSIPNTSTSFSVIQSVSSTGFIMYCAGQSTYGSNFYYFAIG